jgi:hypothetical protein
VHIRHRSTQAAARLHLSSSLSPLRRQRRHTIPLSFLPHLYGSKKSFGMNPMHEPADSNLQVGLMLSFIFFFDSLGRMDPRKNKNGSCSCNQISGSGLFVEFFLGFKGAISVIWSTPIHFLVVFLCIQINRRHSQLASRPDAMLSRLENNMTPLIRNAGFSPLSWYSKKQRCTLWCTPWQLDWSTNKRQPSNPRKWTPHNNFRVQ